METVSIAECAQRFPLLGFGALGLAGLLLASLVPRLRLRLSTMLEMPLPSTKQHLLPIDSFRGLAALWVALYHGVQWTYPVFSSVTAELPFLSVGQYGVQFFAVISGLLIYRSLRNVRTLDGLRAYFWRRLLRICPLYVVVSLVFVLLSQPKFSNVLAELFMFRTLGYPTFMNPVTWSVYVEVLFYLVMPAFVLLAYKRPALGASAVFLLLMLGERGSGRDFALWKFFLLGVLCSELIDRLHGAGRPGTRNWWGWGLFAAGSGLLVLGVLSALRGGLLGYSEREIAIGLGVALAICGSVLEPHLRRLFALRPLRILGTVSYSVYLLHPLLLLLSFDLGFSLDGMTVLKRGYEPVLATTAAFFLLYVPALVFYSCCSFLAVERVMLKLRPKNAG